MNCNDKLRSACASRKSILCVGLDIDPRKVPQSLAGSSKGLFTFTMKIIEATSDVVAAYKPNLAFFEALGVEGVSLLKQICERIPKELVLILDGKRGDIGNTSLQYAQSMHRTFGADWVTVNPYMGADSVKPFLENKDKGAFVLCLTSNPGSSDFQTLDCGGRPLYERVLEKCHEWNTLGNTGIVVGATHPEQLSYIRENAGDMPILLPGIGAQGGALERAALDGTAHFTKPALINISRSVLYASDGPDFAKAAREAVLKMQGQINALRSPDHSPTRVTDIVTDHVTAHAETREDTSPSPMGDGMTSH